MEVYVEVYARGSTQRSREVYMGLCVGLRGSMQRSMWVYVEVHDCLSLVTISCP